MENILAGARTRRRAFRLEQLVDSLNLNSTLRIHPCPARTVAGSSVREVLEAYFAGNPQARSYVLDDQSALRKHMALFINGEPVLDRTSLADAVPADAVVDVFQALSGG
jgi:hypothetical protein